MSKILDIYRKLRHKEPKLIKIKGYIAITDGSTPKETLKKSVWVINDEEPATPYFQIEVRITKHETRGSYERN